MGEVGEEGAGSVCGYGYTVGEWGCVGGHQADRGWNVDWSIHM